MAVLLGSLYLPLGVFFIGGANYILLFYEFVCRLALKLPFRTILLGRPSLFIIILYYILLFLLISINQNKKKIEVKSSYYTKKSSSEDLNKVCWRGRREKKRRLPHISKQFLYTLMIKNELRKILSIIILLSMMILFINPRDGNLNVTFLDVGTRRWHFHGDA